MWTGHIHGFGPWTGSPDSYHREGDRRPPPPSTPAPPMSGDDTAGIRILRRYREVTADFPASRLPPMMTGQWLMKANQASPRRTWDEAPAALDWLVEQYLANPPVEREDGRRAYASLDAKRRYALDALPVGVDVSWVYYNHSGSIVSVGLVCCPNRHHPGLPCPLGRLGS
ncbi:hypothetical protein [Streptomyces sp. NPDC048001]|uniref:hypothetical protein n=1 Tax=Streptomyces sp. NPDC048001 TaxID=3365498 RepID=UPI0037199D84